jgi:hypothetical protein
MRFGFSTLTRSVPLFVLFGAREPAQLTYSRLMRETSEIPLSSGVLYGV